MHSGPMKLTIRSPESSHSVKLDDPTYIQDTVTVDNRQGSLVIILGSSLFPSNFIDFTKMNATLPFLRSGPFHRYSKCWPVLSPECTSESTHLDASEVVGWGGAWLSWCRVEPGPDKTQHLIPEITTSKPDVSGLSASTWQDWPHQMQKGVKCFFLHHV
jgi:hypothetical protein